MALVQPSENSSSTRTPLVQLSNSALSELQVENPLVPSNYDASQLGHEDGSPQPRLAPVVQPSGSDPPELPVGEVASNYNVSNRSGYQSIPLSQPLTPMVQPSPSPTRSNQENAGSIVPRSRHEFELEPKPSPLGIVKRTQRAMSNIYQSALKGYKAFVDFSFVFNSFLVIMGIFIMLSGTCIVYITLLPKIYTCPDGATCHHNLDPKGDIVPRLPTIMQYWLQAGVFVAGLGLSKFITYESWFVVKGPNGSTIRTLEREIRAVGGSWFDALLLVPKPLTASPQPRGARWLGILALIQFGIGLLISAVVSFSITDLQGTRSVYVPFTYHSDFAIPRQDIRFVSTGEYLINNQLTSWLLPLGGSQRPITVFDGTLVLRDNRTISAINFQPSGSRVTGNISCSRQGWNTSLVSLDSPYLADGHGALPPGAKAYNLTNGTFWFVSYSYTHLGSIYLSLSELSDSVTTRQYLWASNTSNVVPNATASPDGGLYYAACNHTTRLVDLPVVGPGAQDIHPSQPIIYTSADDPFLNPCPSTDPMACLSRFIDEAVLAFWQASVVQLDLIPFSCVTDVLVGYDGLSDTPDCALDDVRWATTLSTAMDALIYTAGLSGNATQTQHLWATANSINTERWWIQTTLPGVTFLLYLACVVYTSYLSPGAHPNLRALALSDILYDEAQLEPLPYADKPDMKVTMLPALPETQREREQ